jgi:glycosyltransferase involved in cell wall biosynthesis
MRIVALIHFYVPVHMAGSETMLHAMLAALARAGHDVHAVVTCEPEPAEDVVDGVQVHRRNRVKADEAVLALKPDVIVTHHDEVHRARRLSLRTRARLVHLLHSNIPHACRPTAVQSPDLVVFNTNWVRDSFLATYAPPRASMVLHPPIDGAKHRVRPGSKVTLVNLSEAKGARVFYALADARPDVDFLGVVGAHGEQIIEDHPNVEIHPHTADPREFWSQTRILLAPSSHESFGMVAIEAGHSGIPTIAHPTPGLRESLGNAGTFAHRTVLSDWLEALDRLLGEREWKAASKAARARARSFDSEGGLKAWVTAVEALAR